jgi:hypothetical protein
MSITVKYGNGGKPADPVRDELILTDQRAITRARRILDDEYWSRVVRTVRIAYRGIREGDIVRIADALRPGGESYYVRSSIIEARDGALIQTLRLEGAFREP